ncbi:hypothetical protein ACFV98_36700 [Streptomyces violascens]|uniref:hypothetical protein n=1 Tax=Streptomyces violascens TaxID=67381 RepID=UPI00365EBDD2
MKSIGWHLPSRADGQDCQEIASNTFESGWAGEFQMPQREARDWLTALRGTHADLREDDRLHLSIVPPSYGRIDSVDVDIRWEGEVRAVVTFKTYNG